MNSNVNRTTNLDEICFENIPRFDLMIRKSKRANILSRFRMLILGLGLFTGSYGQEYLIGLNAALGNANMLNRSEYKDYYQVYNLDDEYAYFVIESVLNAEFKKGFYLIGGLGYLRQNTTVADVHAITLPLGVGVKYGGLLCFFTSLQARTNFIVSPTDFFEGEDIMVFKPMIYKPSRVELQVQLELGLLRRYKESELSFSLIHYGGLTPIMTGNWVDNTGTTWLNTHGILFSLSYKRYLNFGEEKPD